MHAFSSSVLAIYEGREYLYLLKISAETAERDALMSFIY